MSEFWGLAEQSVRDALFQATGLIKDEELSGLLFGIGLVLSDHVFRLVESVVP